MCTALDASEDGRGVARRAPHRYRGDVGMSFDIAGIRTEDGESACKREWILRLSEGLRAGA
jgi:hypothetical protein